MQETVVRYSESFKLRIVQELEEGKLRSINEAKKKYGIAEWLTLPDYSATIHHPRRRKAPL